MVRQVCSIVRASALRSRVFILAKACSIGLRSGEEAGRRKGLALGARVAGRMARPLWLPRLSITTMSPGARMGTRTCSTYAPQVEPLVGPSMTQGAVRPSQRSAAKNVRVRHLPKGALATRRSPLGHRPWARVMLVLAQVGLGPGLVDEDKPPRIDPRLTRLPPFTPPGDVRSVLFGGAKTFF